MRSFQIASVATAGFLLLLAIPAAAQLKLGETSTSGTGTLSSGYTATYGNMMNSSHGWTFGGVGNFSGYFHSPNFLSYNFSPYLNQSRANSNFQSTSEASGVNLSANIFSGSKFPGSISYSKAYNSEGNYAVPGLANFVTHGNSDTFGINWSENLPDAPSFSAGFQTGRSQYNVYGANSGGNNSFHSLNLHSGYKWAGFNMGAYYITGTNHSLVPQVLTGTPFNIQSTNDSYGYNLSHILPLHGAVSAGINRSTWNSDYLGTSSNGSIDTATVNAGVHPTNKVSLTTTVNYSDNLAGQIIQSVIAAGGSASGLNNDQSSNSLDVSTVGTYTPLPNLQASAFFERRTQNFLGENYGVRSYGGNATFTHTLLNGTINSSASVTANSSEQSGQDTIGLSASENYSNVLYGWHLNESFSYAQNVQTLLVTYMNSFYNYSGNVRRNWGLFSVSAGAGGSRTALTDQPGTTSSGESYNASLGFGSYLTATGNYSKSDGEALATGAGLIGVPVPSPVLPSDLVSLFGGKSYSFGLSSTPMKKLIFAATYAKSTSNTVSNSISSANENSQYNALIQYQLRKLTFVSGYSRLQQGFSITGTRPEIVSSYFTGVSRWFNIF
ncbi:MAG TPA: hypothetical protein VGI45_09705 [Terracidiphilus sp.]